MSSNKNGIKKLLKQAEKAENEEHYEIAADAYEKAANLGDISSMLILGDYYYEGIFTDRNYDKAAKWYKKAAEAENPAAQIKLGTCYLNGEGTEQNLEAAIKWYKAAAEAGYSGGLNHLANEYFFGEGVLEQNYDEAFKRYKAAAEGGNVTAQYLLGRCYLAGNGTEQNYDEALRWLREAAEYDNAYAQNTLGDCYAEGYGVEKNPAAAARWYKMSAEGGCEYGQVNLGLCYLKGEGVEEDSEEGIFWLIQAAKQGYSAAEDILKELLGEDFDLEAFEDNDDFDFDNEDGEEDYDGEDNNDGGPDMFRARYYSEFRAIPEIIAFDPAQAISELSENREEAANAIYKEAFEGLSNEAYPFVKDDFSVEVYSASNCQKDAVVIITYPKHEGGNIICLKGCVVFAKDEDDKWVSGYITVETDYVNGNDGSVCFLGGFIDGNHINYGIVPKGKTKLFDRIEEIAFGGKRKSRKFVKIN